MKLLTVALIAITLNFASSQVATSQRDIARQVEKLDASTKKTILTLHGQGVKKQDIAARIGYVVKDKAKALKIVEAVTAEAKKHDPKKKRDEALSAKRKLTERKNLIKKQERENKTRKRKMRNEM
mmetsp:Transcript_27880/g.28150  ORF Transcript_27880/g.28150 Transcript_27880/m.28150 type:complete len:125 (-) Transcript_27880:138-512(-)